VEVEVEVIVLVTVICNSAGLVEIVGLGVNTTGGPTMIDGSVNG